MDGVRVRVEEAAHARRDDGVEPARAERVRLIARRGLERGGEVRPKARRHERDERDVRTGVDVKIVGHASRPAVAAD